MWAASAWSSQPNTELHQCVLWLIPHRKKEPPVQSGTRWPAPCLPGKLSITMSKELISEDEENTLSVFMFPFLHTFKDFSFAIWPSQAQGQGLFYVYAQHSVQLAWFSWDCSKKCNTSHHRWNISIFFPGGRKKSKLEDNSLFQFILSGKRRKEKSGFDDFPSWGNWGHERSHIGISPQKTVVV